MLRSLLIKLSMLGVTLGALIWIGTTTPIRQVTEPPPRPVSQPPVRSALPAAIPASPPAVAPGPEVKVKPDRGTEQAETVAKAKSVQEPAQTDAPVRLAESRRVDLNRASVTDLEGLPGIGPKLAQRVVEHRTSRGPFHSVEELQQVKGIGRKKFDRLRPFVLVTNTKVPSRH
ncbi:MAG: helix-hairpin-helix domain-containing protein [Nitrospiraceae bacterium]|nr:helix-hairpin-helix domain-containing protein [Nitrospiraceae bacterium]